MSQLSEMSTRKQPWRTWYAKVGELDFVSYFIRPALIAGNGTNGSDNVLSLGIDLSVPKSKPERLSNSGLLVKSDNPEH